MSKKRIVKIVGRISDDIADRHGLEEYRGQEIVQSLDLYIHIAKKVVINCCKEKRCPRILEIG